MAKFLPLVNSELIDRKPQGGLSSAVGKSVLLVGYCSNVLTGEDNTLLFPTNEPMQVDSLSYMYKLTKNHDGTPSELSEALWEAYQESPNNISLMRMGTVYSTQEKFCNIMLSGDSYVVLGFSGESGVTSDFADAVLLSSEDRYDDLEAAYTALEDYQFDYIVPIGAYLDESISGKDFGYQLALHCYKKSKTTKNTFGVLPVNTALRLAYLSDPTVNYRTGTPTGTQVTTWVNTLTLVSGSNYGCTNFDPKTPGSLSAYPEDDTTTATPTNHAWFLNTAESDVPTKYTDGSVAKDSDGVPIDLGKYVSVVATNTRYSNKAAQELDPVKRFYNKNAYVSVAAILSTLNSTESLTNRPTSISLQEKFIRDAVSDRLCGFGYITISDTNGYRAFGVGWTGAHHVSQYSRSDYDVESTMRITQDVVEAIRNKIRPYLGKRGNTTGMETDITSVLMNYVRVGAIMNGYDFDIYQKSTTSSLGVYYLELSLIIAPEIRQVKIVTRIS